MRFSKLVWIIVVALLAGHQTLAQSRNSIKTSPTSEGTVLSVFAERMDGSAAPITPEEISLYERGSEQRLRNFVFDPSPARILLLIDNSQTLRAEIPILKKAVMEFAYEIFEGDQLFVVGYDEQPEIIQEWTDSAEKLETSLSAIRKKGNPYLFDALSTSINEVLVPLTPGNRKTVVVLISDGLDRGSKTSFKGLVAELQEKDVTVYALQIPDRSNGAFRRNQPKAPAVIAQLAEETGGLVFSIDRAREAAKIICDELKKNRYLVSYFRQNTVLSEDHRLLVVGREGIKIRAKSAWPATVKE